jgi:NADH-quinone oxidoreductase subunit I
MFGIGVLKGLKVTLKEFVATYVDDIKRIPSRYAGGRGVIDQTQNLSEQTGLFTIQYPEERRKLPERFRYIPMLIYEADTGEDRCTACGICAKVCPPQCIWIVRDRDANGKPITRPSEFYIDASICMNCGLCAEFCPFDAIKMNHDFEITAYERMPHLVFDLDELKVPTTYYAALYPTAWAEEEAARAAKAEKSAAKPAAATPAATPATEAGQPSAAVPAATTPAAGGRATPEELERRRAEARARKAAQQAEAGVEAGTPAEANGEGVAGPPPPAAAPAGQPAAPTPEPTPAARPAAAGGRATPEELERRRAEARARKAAQQAQATAAGEGETGPAPAEPPAGEGSSPQTNQGE